MGTSNFKRIAFYVGSGLMLAGCTFAPKYEQPKAPVPVAYPAGRLPVAGTNSPLASTLAWREFIGDDRLRELVALALTHNRDLRVAMLNVEKSRAAYRISRSALAPVVSAGGEYQRAHAKGVTTDTWTASLGSTAYELDIWGRVRSLNAQALENYLSTEEARRGVAIALVAEVATQYFVIRELEEELELTRGTLKTVTEAYDLNQAVFKAGGAGELDVRIAETQVQTAKVNQLELERLRATAEHTLALLLGCEVPPGLPGPKGFHESGLLTPVAPGLPSDLIVSRPDVLAAEHALKAAHGNIGAARAAFLPSVRLTGMVGTASDEFNRLFGAGTGVWSFSPQITVPIFTGGQKRADLDAAKVGRRIEIANYERAIQQAFREVSDALTDLSGYGEQVTARGVLVAAQQARYDLATARYRRGEDDYLAVLSAQQDLYGARQGLLRTELNKLASQVALYRALGGGWK